MGLRARIRKALRIWLGIEHEPVQIEVTEMDSRLAELNSQLARNNQLLDSRFSPLASNPSATIGREDEIGRGEAP